MLTTVRHWFHTDRKPREQHEQIGKAAYFSGEAMEKRAALHATLDRWIDQVVGVADAEKLNVWRLGVLTFRVRMGRATDAESALSLDPITGVELRHPEVTYGELRVLGQVTRCERCLKEVDEDGQVCV